jgi:hypothetical protein
VATVFGRKICLVAWSFHQFFENILSTETLKAETKLAQQPNMQQNIDVS